MKLAKYAKKCGVTYRTAWSWYKSGKIPGAKQMPSGTIIIPEEEIIDNDQANSVGIYARVSSSENKDNLDSQAKRLEDYCVARGYRVVKVVKEIGSGVNDKRKKLEKLLLDRKIKKIVVEHSDRFSRFGINYISKLMELDGRSLEIVNKQGSDKDDLMQDFVSIITSFVARLYGLRRSKRRTEKLIAQLRDRGN